MQAMTKSHKQHTQSLLLLISTLLLSFPLHNTQAFSLSHHHSTVISSTNTLHLSLFSDFPSIRIKASDTAKTTTTTTTTPKSSPITEFQRKRRQHAISRLFGKLAESHLLIDISNGSCCYSGCPGCDFWNDDGSYRSSQVRFRRDDIATTAEEEAAAVAAAAVWIPSYSNRYLGDDETSHVSKWSQLLFGMKTKRRVVTKEEFVRILKEADVCYPVVRCDDVRYVDTPGVMIVSDGKVVLDASSSSSSTTKEEKRLNVANDPFSGIAAVEMAAEDRNCDEEVLDALWRVLAKSSVIGDEDGVEEKSATKGQVSKRLKKWGEDGVEGLGLESFEMGLLMEMGC